MMQNKNSKIVVFDFGGVLFKTSATAMYRERFKQTGRNEAQLQHFLKNIFTKESRSAANKGTMVAITNALAARYPDWADDILAFNADRDFIKQIRGILPGMEQTLNDIAAAGHPVYGLTNWASDTFETLRNAYPQISNLFNHIVVSGSVGLKKPDARIFELT